MKFLLIIILLILHSCANFSPKSAPFYVGVESKTFNPHHHWIKATGMASAESIEADDYFKKKVTSCQAAKDMGLFRLKELEPNQKYREFFIENLTQRFSDDGMYCEYSFEYNIEKDKTKDKD
jgi:hypothetical protein